MPTGVLINGASGRMGQVATVAIENDPDLHIAGKSHRTDDLTACIRNIKPDVVLDLTTATVAYTNATTIIDAGVSPVIGTSGLLPHQTDELVAICEDRKLGGVIIPNFSITSVLMMRFAAQAARYLPEVEIIETHHAAKMDAPSATALRTAELISEERQNHTPPDEASGARGVLHAGVRIHAVRLPSRLAHQERSILLGSRRGLHARPSGKSVWSAYGHRYAEAGDNVSPRRLRLQTKVAGGSARIEPGFAFQLDPALLQRG